MAEQELLILIRLRDDASAQLRQISATLEANRKEWHEHFGALITSARQAGIALSAFGATIMGTFALSFKAAEENRLEIARLTISLRNLGVNYDDVKTSLNAYIESTQKLTGIARSEQMAALQNLLLITGDYNRAMQLLPIALDLAKAKQMDITTAALLLGRVVEGDINALHRYGFAMDGVKSAGQALEIIQNKVTGSAQAMLSPLDTIKNSMKDLLEIIGGLVSGPIANFLSSASGMLRYIKDWAGKNSELARSLAELGIIIGLGALITGGMILAAVGLAAAFAVLGGPITMVLLGIGALISAGILMALKWDTVKEHWTEVWMVIKAVIMAFIGPWGYVVGLLLQSAFDIIKVWDTTR